MATPGRRLDRFERSYVIGVRVMQLMQGERPVHLCDHPRSMHDIAVEDLEACGLDYVLGKRAPDGTLQRWRVLPGFRCSRVADAGER